MQFFAGGVGFFCGWNGVKGVHMELVMPFSAGGMRLRGSRWSF